MSTIAKPHNHPSDKTAVEREKCRQIMKQLVGHSHPAIWKLIETLQVEANRIASILIQSDRGIRQKKRTKRIHAELQTRLKNLCKDRLQGRKSIAEFLRGVSLNIRGGQPHI